MIQETEISTFIVINSITVFKLLADQNKNKKIFIYDMSEHDIIIVDIYALIFN